MNEKQGVLNGVGVALGLNEGVVFSFLVCTAGGPSQPGKATHGDNE